MVIYSVADPGSEIFPSRISIKEFNSKNCFSALGIMIRIVYSGSEFFPIPDPGSASKNLTQKLFLSSSKYDLDCKSWIRIPDSDPDVLPIPDPGSRDQKGTGSRIRIRNTVAVK
jgi:hypothetical protein